MAALRSTSWDCRGVVRSPAVPRQSPPRCRRLILVSTATGSVMIPGKPAVLAKMLTPRRFLDHRYAARMAPHLYGGSARNDPHMIKRLFDRQLMAGSRIGYLHQLLAGMLDEHLCVAAHPATDAHHRGHRRSHHPACQRKDHESATARCDAARARRRPRRTRARRGRAGTSDRGIPQAHVTGGR